MLDACYYGRVEEVRQLLKEAPSLLHASLREVPFFCLFCFLFVLFFVFSSFFFLFLFFVFFFVFCFLFFCFCFLFLFSLLFVGSCVM